MRQPSSRWIRLLELAAWAVTALMGALAITQAAGVTGAPIVYVVQALTPFLLTPAVPLGVVAMLANRHLLALTNVSIAGALLVLCAPVVFHADPPVIGEDATRLRVAHSNAYFESTLPAAAASTLLSFGLLALSATPALHAFGLTLLFGVFLAWLLTPLFMPDA